MPDILHALRDAFGGTAAPSIAGTPEILDNIAVALARNIPGKPGALKKSAHGLLDRLRFPQGDAVTAEARAQAENFLRKRKVHFQRRADGMLLVPGHLELKKQELRRLPDLSCVIVAGNFHCGENGLRSLAGAPAFVGGTFDCSANALETLEGAPQSVGGNFICDANGLRMLRGAPRAVGGGFYASTNQLITLDGGPKTVGTDYFCQGNKLISLYGAPLAAKHFNCAGNALVTLDNAPRTYDALYTDFGTFETENDIPDTVRPERPAETVALGVALSVGRPLRFRTPKRGK